jgi:acyl-CoA reductase-like NAD-dependent aldehyde dehydrogenase
MISEREAMRLESWIEEAAGKGATLLCGGSRVGNMLEATLMEGVTRDCAAYAQEAFGPLAILSSFNDFDAAMAEVNDSAFGLQAGVFTRDLYKMQRAWDTLDVGGVVIGDIPSWRVDHMPYGGVKDSGLGREGIVYAMEDMTEIRLLVIRTPPSER